MEDHEPEDVQMRQTLLVDMRKAAVTYLQGLKDQGFVGLRFNPALFRLQSLWQSDAAQILYEV